MREGKVCFPPVVLPAVTAVPQRFACHPPSSLPRSPPSTLSTGAVGGRGRRCRREPQRGEQHAELIQCLGAFRVGRRRSGACFNRRDNMIMSVGAWRRSSSACFNRINKRRPRRGVMAAMVSVGFRRRQDLLPQGHVEHDGHRCLEECHVAAGRCLPSAARNNTLQYRSSFMYRCQQSNEGSSKHFS